MVVLSAAGAAEIFARMQDAIREARTSLPAGGRIRVGLTGLSNDARSTTTAMFVPCMNITFAARQIAQVIERCTAIPHFKADPLYCAIAVYRGSWERPDTIFADAVKASVVKGDAPNFDILQDGDFDSSDIASHTLKPGRDGAQTAPALSSDDRERGRSSALFPAKPPHADTVPVDMPNHDRSAEVLRSPGHVGASPTTTNPWGDSLFVRRSSERRP